MSIYAKVGEKIYKVEKGVKGWVNWNTPELKEILVENGELTIGIAIKSDAGGWGTIDDFVCYLSRKKVEDNNNGGGSTGGSTSDGATTTPSSSNSFLNSYNKLDVEKQKEITTALKQYMPATFLNKDQAIAYIEKLTGSIFTKEQLKALVVDSKALEKMGIVIHLVTLVPVQEVTFKDVDNKHWAYANIEKALKLGLAAGVSEMEFAPSKALTVADTFTFLDRVLLLNDQLETKLPRENVSKIGRAHV